VVEDTTRNQGDLDDQFKETVQRAVTKLVVKEVVEKPTMDDQNKTFRTRLVSVWMLTNAILAVAIQNINGIRNTEDPDADEEALRSKQNLYFAVILYSTFGLSLIRFIGVSSGPTCFLAREKRAKGDYTFSVCTTGSGGTCSDAAGGTKCRREGREWKRIRDLIKRVHSVDAIPCFLLPCAYVSTLIPLHQTQRLRNPFFKSNTFFFLCGRCSELRIRIEFHGCIDVKLDGRASYLRRSPEATEERNGRYRMQ